MALGRGLPRPTRGQWVSIVTIGVLWFGIYNVALNAGEQHVDAGTAVMLIQVSPVLVALLAATFLHERFTLYLGLGLALAFGGVALIATASSDSSGDRSVLGVVLCLVAVVILASTLAIAVLDLHTVFLLVPVLLTVAVLALDGSGLRPCRRPGP